MHCLAQWAAVESLRRNENLLRVTMNVLYANLAVSDMTNNSYGSPCLMVVLSISAGTFVILGVIKDWDWFFDWTCTDTLLGRRASRVFFGLLGAVFIGFAFFLNQTAL